MTASVVSSLDLRTIESVLEMGRGYVLDFSDRTFSEFFHDHGIDIDNERYREDGTSKAKRLRCFLRNTTPPLTGRVLASLLEHRLAAQMDELDADHATRYVKIIERLGGTAPAGVRTKAQEEAAEAILLRRVFRPEVFAKLPCDQVLRDALLDRLREAQRCIDGEAYLSAVILCGSVLEGMCLGFGSAKPELVNRGYQAHYGKPPKRLHEWKLAEWIEVLTSLGALSPNVSKFGHALRDFRNYVHPAEQVAHGFSPNAHTARIGFQVVIAATDDLVQFVNRGAP